MPKLLVMLLDATDDATRLAAATLDGASSVRFTEVDLRSNAPHDPIAGRRYRALESREGIQNYDGLVLVAANPSSPGLVAFIGELEPFASRGAYANLVIGVTTNQPDSVAPLGGIVITSANMTDPMHEAKHMAARVARVSAWVRHSLDHERHEHHHHDHHDHGRHHDHHAE